jgi:hypothetical protein
MFNLFRSLAERTAHAVETPLAFMLALAMILL